MELQELINLITTNGFAIAVSAYMIIVNTKVVERNTEAINKLVIRLGGDDKNEH